MRRKLFRSSPVDGRKCGGVILAWYRHTKFVQDFFLLARRLALVLLCSPSRRTYFLGFFHFVLRPPPFHLPPYYTPLTFSPSPVFLLIPVWESFPEPIHSTRLDLPCPPIGWVLFNGSQPSLSDSLRPFFLPSFPKLRERKIQDGAACFGCLRSPFPLPCFPL